MEVIPCNEGWTWLQMCYFRLFKQGPCSCIKRHGWLHGDTIAANLQSRPKLESHEDPTKWGTKKKIAKSDNDSNNHGLSDTGFMGLMKTQWT